MKCSSHEIEIDFKGYPPATSNYTCTPNQFFEVVLPYSSRGVVRIVGYMIRQILGWSDAAGNPRNSQLSFTYNELIDKAGVSRAMVKASIDEAISKNFIKCIREPRSASQGVSAVSGLYELKSDDSGVYVDDPGVFQGFYTGEGRFTPTPNTYFDFTLLEEPLSVIKLVGIIIRNTIGFQTKCGFRRTQVALSYQELMAKAGLSRDQLCQAIKLGIQNGHITLVSPGSFSPTAEHRIKATYGVRWTDMPAVQNSDQENSGSKNRPEAERYENRSKSGLKTRPKAVRNSDPERYENQTTIKKVQIQEKQQQRDTAAVSEELVEELVKIGFDSKAALEFITSNNELSIQRELKALKQKKDLRNPAGYLSSAVRNEYSKEKILVTPKSPAHLPYQEEKTEKPKINFQKLRVLKEEKSQDWEKFLKADEITEETLSKTTLISPDMKSRLLFNFEKEEMKLLRFLEYLKSTTIKPFVHLG